jgi:sugar phosphate isomerase/epimerase
MTTDKNRREFLLGAAGSLAAAGVLSRGVALAAIRKMKMDLHTGNVGVKANLQQQIDYAVKYGFEAFDPNLNDLAALSDSAMKQTMDDMAAKNLSFGFLAQSVPVTQPDEKFAEWTKTTLTGWAKTMQRAKITRFCTWLSSSDARLTYLQNFKLHTRRIADVATILGDYGISFGLEYVGPKTGWARSKYPFIHTMESMKELVDATGKSNVGFLLDTWHWYNAGETPADILTLKNKDVVGVHLNDAPKDIPVDQLRDNQREIPMATGVINIGGFLNALNQIGYDGPAAAEPLGSSITKLPPEEAMAKLTEVMKQAMALIQ